MKLSAQLKTILIMLGIAFVLGMGAGVGIYTAIFKPHPKPEIVEKPIQVTVPEVNIELTDSKISTPVAKLPDITIEIPEDDTLYTAEFKIAENSYFGNLTTYFSLKRKLSSYELDLTVKEREIFTETKIEVPVYVNKKSKFLSAYIGGGVGFNFNDGSKINYANLKAGVVIKKTIPIYIQIDTNEVFSINTGVIF